MRIAAHRSPREPLSIRPATRLCRNFARTTVPSPTPSHRSRTPTWGRGAPAPSALRARAKRQRELRRIELWLAVRGGLGVPELLRATVRLVGVCLVHVLAELAEGGPGFSARGLSPDGFIEIGEGGVVVVLQHVGSRAGR